MRTVKLIICALVFAGFSTSAIGQEPGRSEHPRYGTEAGEAGKGEIRAKKYPGNLYGIEAFSKSKRMSPEQSDRVSRQVMLRAAQLALENDRPVFSMFTPTNTLSSVRTRRVAGTAPSTTWVGLHNGLGPAGLREVEVPGTPGYTYELPRYEGAWTMVKLWTREEAARRGSAKDGMTDYDAEGVYRDLVQDTPGQWPSLVALYEDLAERAEATMTDGGPDAQAAHLTAINTHLKLARLYREAGEVESGVSSLERAGQLLRSARQR